MFGLFEIDLKKLLLIGLILALPLISLNLERRDTGTTKWYDQLVLWIVNPSQEFFTRFALGVSHTTGFYMNLLDVKKENRVLKEEVSKLKQELSQREELRIENDRLKKQLEFQQTYPAQLLSAQITAVGPWGEYSSLTLNKGSAEGVRRKMAVVTREGIVGYILNASTHYSVVLVLTDRNAVVDALVQRTRARGIVEGMGKDLCRVKYLQRTDDVQSGDLLVTTGFDDIFPKGFPIGTVTRVSKKNYGVSQTVEIRPVVDITRLEEVFVVLKPDAGQSAPKRTQ